MRLIRSTKREKRLGTLILFVTSRCNAFCKTCFYWDELNRPGDLTRDQLDKISRTMPPITDLWLSGGEPTLRTDLAGIIDGFINRNGAKRVIIPTNGLAQKRTYELVERTLAGHAGVHLYLNVALDGYGKTHDEIRGVPGNWVRTLRCIESLYPLKESYGDRFRLNVNTVICAQNYSEIDKLAEYLWRDYRLDGHYFNLIRGDAQAGEEIKRIPVDILPGLYRRASELTKRYGDRMFAGDTAAARLVKNIAYVGAITTHYKIEASNFEHSKAWPMPCTAGDTTAVIDYNGDVRACELRGKFASLAEYDYDFGQLWSDQARQEELDRIDGGKSCWCTHVCFIHDSMRHSRRTLLTELPRNYFTRASLWKA